MAVQSPLTFSNNVSLERAIDVSDIIRVYKDQYNLDVSRFFADCDKVFIHRCNDTGYRFYHPLSLSGDGKFYEELQALPGYYPSWKWEHSKVKKFLKKGDKVLEIGCAEGSFLQELKTEGIDCVGLELNEKAVTVARSKGLTISNESIQEHAIENRGKYDVVCSFQVMEHIAEINEVLQASIDVLRAGGTLFIAVPNNDSFIFHDTEHTLNLPPHHMGLWNKRSLQSLEKFFPIKYDKVFFEKPLAIHRQEYCSVKNKLKKERRENRAVRYGKLGKLSNRVLGHFDSFLLKRQYPTLGNFTIVAKYTRY